MSGFHDWCHIYVPIAFDSDCRFTVAGNKVVVTWPANEAERLQPREEVLLEFDEDTVQRLNTTNDVSSHEAQQAFMEGFPDLHNQGPSDGESDLRRTH
ncbi:hypothetical protein [Uliginosibacterium sp. H1]|uniref:hypothetical protein n=1 Tax=Uliginosibacterium sp. H1 TaxID=3114757 RepID=UPI002E19D529|nr:hypothetical protein [Uliginosibacterium sp. H1]